jgi:hypothetical protein
VLVISWAKIVVAFRRTIVSGVNSTDRSHDTRDVMPLVAPYIRKNDPQRPGNSTSRREAAGYRTPKPKLEAVGPRAPAGGFFS